MPILQPSALGPSPPPALGAALDPPPLLHAAAITIALAASTSTRLFNTYRLLQ
jgi:hypothetical protein